MSMLNIKLLCSILISFMLVSTNINIHMEMDKQLASSLTQHKNSKDACADKKLDKAKLEEFKLKKLSYIAAYFGINTKGKTIEQLQSEIEQAKQAQPEKWELLKKELHDKKLKMLEQKQRSPIK